MKFATGQMVATPGALEAITALELTSFINRHINGDWGNLDEEDKKMNDDALVHGNRLMSSYTTEQGVKIWIITEADRSSTTVLLPEDY